jgi:hypothetical protein
MVNPNLKKRNKTHSIPLRKPKKKLIGSKTNRIFDGLDKALHVKNSISTL